VGFALGGPDEILIGQQRDIKAFQIGCGLCMRNVPSKTEIWEITDLHLPVSNISLGTANDLEIRPGTKRRDGRDHLHPFALI